MRKLYVYVIIMILSLTPASLSADTHDAKSILEKTKKNYESYTTSQKVHIIIRDGDQITAQLVAGMARKMFPDGTRGLLMLLEPKDVKGLAFLYHELGDQTLDQWVYSPFVGRVRKITGVSTYESFLSTDFTYGDLTFINRKNELKLLGEEALNGITAYKIEEIPKRQNYGYSRTIIWISKDRFIPVRRDFYDTSNTLWKRQSFGNAAVINGQLMILTVRMMDLKAKTSTEFNVIEVNSNIEIPDEIFVPKQLEYSLKCPIWEKVCYPDLK